MKPFQPPRKGAVMHVHPCVTARNDRESNFHHSGGPVQDPGKTQFTAVYLMRGPDKAVLTAMLVL